MNCLQPRFDEKVQLRVLTCPTLNSVGVELGVGPALHGGGEGLLIFERVGALLLASQFAFPAVTGRRLGAHLIVDVGRAC